MFTVEQLGAKAKKASDSGSKNEQKKASKKPSLAVKGGKPG